MTRFRMFSTMKEIMTEYYIEAKTTREKPIAWITSGAPVEFLYAMDVFPVYPENHAAMCAASHVSLDLMEVAEAEGYSQDICSYARTDIGADISKSGPIGGLPDPDLLICSTNICKTVIKWYEVIARKYSVPLFVVDTPFLHDGISSELINYTIAQFKDLERFLADFTNSPFDKDRFSDVLALAEEASAFWKRSLELGKTIPSPFNSQDTFIHMAPIVTMRGTEKCRDYYCGLYEEIRELASQKIASVPGETYRVLWDNLPVWFKMKRLSEFFEKNRCALVTATYTNSWGGIRSIEDYHDDKYERLAASYLFQYINLGFEDRISYLTKLIDEFALTGFIMHSNRSCKPYSLGMYQLREEVSKRSGIPGVIIEADQNDPRVYAETQIETRLEAFIESM